MEWLLKEAGYGGRAGVGDGARRCRLGWCWHSAGCLR